MARTLDVGDGSVFKVDGKYYKYTYMEDMGGLAMYVEFEPYLRRGGTVVLPNRATPYEEVLIEYFKTTNQKIKRIEIYLDPENGYNSADPDRVSAEMVLKRVKLVGIYDFEVNEGDVVRTYLTEDTRTKETFDLKSDGDVFSFFRDDRQTSMSRENVKNKGWYKIDRDFFKFCLDTICNIDNVRSVMGYWQ